VEDLLRDQWAALRGWLDEADVVARREQPSGLEGWTLGDLVAHLGYGITMIADVSPAPDLTEPMTFGAYVGHYPPAASVIAEQTRERALATATDLLAGVDAAAERAWAALDALDCRLVRGRRGPLTREDYLTTRLLELVVHADDLHRAVPVSGHPALPDAVAAVAGTLARAYTERTGAPPQDAEGYKWIRRAAGRTPSDDPALPLL
jgi:uncharacterized protein (TIGR03083 family)